MSRYCRRQLEALERVAALTQAAERVDNERNRAIDDALVAGCLVTHVAESANRSRQYLYRNHNATATGVRARRQKVELLREQLSAHPAGEHTKTERTDMTMGMSKHPKHRRRA